MNFTCRHCGSMQLVSDKGHRSSVDSLYFDNFAEAAGHVDRNACLLVHTAAIRCANADCNRLSVSVALGVGQVVSGSPKSIDGTVFFSGPLYPLEHGKSFPAGVPESLLNDYHEAWAIVGLSAKSSATLARRCLQAMIRDFCGIRQRTLFQEIQTLELRLKEDSLPKGVDSETVEAMKALKDVGNIGAHMTEVDGVIVDVEPGEAEALLGLIEMLFADWYVARHKRQERLAKIQAIAESKKA